MLIFIFVADGIISCLADVIAIMADGIAIYIYIGWSEGRCYSLCGRCYGYI